MKILHNHVGYLPDVPKIALVEAPVESGLSAFSVRNAFGGPEMLAGTVEPVGSVEGWNDWHYWRADFSSLAHTGQYQIVIQTAAGPVVGAPFAIGPDLFGNRMLSDLLHYFKSQRSSGIFDRADREVPKLDSGERVDAHGGWYDASGDSSKYLSHLSYASFLNPQQIPLVVWVLAAARDTRGELAPYLAERWADETAYGADALVRFQDPEGYFYTTVFDGWSKDPDRRQITAFEGQAGVLSNAYRAGWRQGGGMAIAALARAAHALSRDGEFTRPEYLAAASRGFDHLQDNGDAYLEDGSENIIDDYCALLAGTELFCASQDRRFAAAADARARSLIGRLTPEGWWRADDKGERSFFHASDAGLPYVALMRYLEVVGADSAVTAAISAALCFETDLTDRVANPFRYPRQLVTSSAQSAHARFFMPHTNESGYWWQGENARLASLGVAYTLARRMIGGDLGGRLESGAAAALDWIMGRNPYDMSMFAGHGRNNPDYIQGHHNALGGVCNGITGAADDSEGIAFFGADEIGPGDSWRWSEQWLPHAAWLFLALAERSRET